MSAAQPPVPEYDTTARSSRAEEASFDDQRVVTTHAGTRVPALGLGTWQLSDDEAADAVTHAIEIGYRHIDTAQMYGNEVGVGRGVDRAGVDRAELFLTTKLSNDHHEPDQVVESLARSCEALGTDHVDLFLMHWPVDEDRISATLAAMANVQAAGTARHIGVSNFTVEQLDRVEHMAPLEVLQVECHPFLQQRALRRWCAEHGWAFTAYSPIARGDVFDDERLEAIAADHDTHAAAVSLAWLLSEGLSAIPKSSSEEHLVDNWRASAVRLSDADVAKINELDEGHRLVDPEFAPW